MAFVFAVTICLACWDAICLVYITQVAGDSILHRCRPLSPSQPLTSSAGIGDLGPLRLEGVGRADNGTRMNATVDRRSRPLTWGQIKCPKDSVPTSAGGMLMAVALPCLLLVVYGIFTVFTLMMAVMQAHQIMQNVTTNELVNYHRYEGWTQDDGSYVNPYDRGCIANCREFLQCYAAYFVHGVGTGSRRKKKDRGYEMMSLLRSAASDIPRARGDEEGGEMKEEKGCESTDADCEIECAIEDLEGGWRERGGGRFRGMQM